MVGLYDLVYCPSFGVISSWFPYADFFPVLWKNIQSINSIFFCPQVSRVSCESSEASVAVGVEAMGLQKEGSQSLEVALQVK